MKATKERVAAAKTVVEEAKAWAWGAECEIGTDGWETWKEKARMALAAVGKVLEDALMDGTEACNAVRAEFGLGPMEELPWDGVDELVGWDVVVEREG